MRLADPRVRFVLTFVALLVAFKASEWLWTETSIYLGAIVSIVLLPLVSMLAMWKGKYLYRTFQWYPLAWIVLVFSAVPPLFVIIGTVFMFNWTELVEQLAG